MWLALITTVALADPHDACVQAGRDDCDGLAAWVQPLPEDVPEAGWQRACAAGDAAACYALAERYVEIDPGGHQEVWTALFERSCAVGHDPGCERLLEITGTAPLRWLSERLERASRACESGDGGGCLDVAMLLDAGARTMTQRAPSAEDRRAWLDLQCAQGLAPACHAAGLSWAEEADARERALQQLDMACRLGEREACRAARRVSRGRAP